MLNTLLFVHLMIAILLVIVILLQKTATDGLSGIGGGNGNMGLISNQSATSFFTRTTIILCIIFFTSSIILANLSSKSQKIIIDKIDSVKSTDKINNDNIGAELGDNPLVPVAK